MPNQNAIVSSVVRIDGGAVVLGNQRRVLVSLGQTGSQTLLDLLERLRRLSCPVYFEVEPQTSLIVRVRVPVVARVVHLAISGDDLLVQLDNSHAVRVLRRALPDFGEFDEALKTVLGQDRPLIVTDDEAHDIIDVRSFQPGPDGTLPPLPPFARPQRLKWPWPLDWLLAIWYLPCGPGWLFRPSVSALRAKQVFDAIATTTCNPLTVPGSCIPFMYPDDGCWGRAHEMCRLMIAMGVKPRKVWINYVGSLLKVSTRNHPHCQVQWTWHVAPTLCVRGRWFAFTCPEDYVIDPSLFAAPVTVATWKAVQCDPNATLTDTPWSYFHQGGSLDPTFTATNVVLETHRALLQARALSAFGPPPYTACP